MIFLKLIFFKNIMYWKKYLLMIWMENFLLWLYFLENLIFLLMLKLLLFIFYLTNFIFLVYILLIFIIIIFFIKILIKFTLLIKDVNWSQHYLNESSFNWLNLSIDELDKFIIFMIYSAFLNNNNMCLIYWRYFLLWLVCIGVIFL